MRDWPVKQSLNFCTKMFFLALLALWSTCSHAEDETPSSVKITLLAPDNAPFWRRMTSFSEKAASDLGMSLEVINSAQSGDEMLAAAVWSIRNGSDGIITHGADKAVFKIMELAEATKTPLILINTDASQGQLRPREQYKYWIGSIIPDDFEAGRTLTRKLLYLREQQGQKKPSILALGGWPEEVTSDSSHLRLNGMRDLIQSYHDDIPVKVFPAKWDPELAKSIALREIGKDPGISIVWSANDHMARTIGGLKLRGLIPKDILIGGIDWDAETAEALHSDLMNVSVGGHFLDGAWATVLLFDYLNGVDFAFQQIEFSSVMTAVDKQTLSGVESLFSANPDSVDFSNYSLYLNPNSHNYDFSLGRLFEKTQSKVLRLSPELRNHLREKKTLRGGVFEDSQPISFFDASLNYSGVASGYISELSDRLQVPIDVVRLKDKRSLLASLRKNEIDFYPVALHSPNLSASYLLTDPYVAYKLVAVGPNNTKRFHSMSDLSGHKVGLVSQNRHGHTSRQLINENTSILFNHFESFENANEALKNGEISVIVLDRASATYNLHPFGRGLLSIHFELPYRVEYAIAVAADDQNLREILNQAINTISNQTRAEINNRWFISYQGNQELLKRYINYAILVVLLLFSIFIMGFIYIHKLRKAQAAINSANEAKSAFLANISHEIRTPMNAIIGLTNQTIKITNDKKALTLLNSVQTSSQHLLALLNDILDFSKVESGKIELESREFSLNNTLEEVAKLTYLKATEKKIQYNYYVPLDLRDVFIGDPVRISQILINLLNNALKFTPEGGSVSLSMNSEKISDCICLVNFKVEDSGVGIEASALPNLFNRFSQADVSTTRKFGGTGLGLSICKQLSNLMDGDITVSSRINQGSTFNCSVQLLVDTDRINTQLSICQKNIANTGISSIAYLGRDSSHKTQFKQWSDKLQLHSRCFDEFSQAQNCDLEFDAWVVDSKSITEPTTLKIIGPVKDLEEIFGSPTLVVFTHQHNQLDELPELNIYNFITTPLTPISLSRELSLLTTSKSHHPEDQSVIEPRSKNTSNNLIGIRVLLVEDNVLNRELALMILEDAEATVIHAENGQEAIQILNKSEIDIILMDCQMPVMDGYDATRAIRCHDQWKQTPIIAMTANAMEGDREKALEAGMNDYLTKPIDEHHLIATLKKWVLFHQER